jgi:CheY-like chemotaxis protein
MEILLVEDSLSDARLTIETLKDGPVVHRLTLVRDGQEALDFLHRERAFTHAPRPDLILLDLHLPRKDGREILDAIKLDESLRRIPVVVLTASKQSEVLLRSEHLQVESYLAKPVDVTEFLDIVKQLNRFWRADILLPPLS